MPGYYDLFQIKQMKTSGTYPGIDRELCKALGKAQRELFLFTLESQEGNHTNLPLDIVKVQKTMSATSLKGD